MCCIVIKQGQIILSAETCCVEPNTVLSRQERAGSVSFVCSFVACLLIVAHVLNSRTPAYSAITLIAYAKEITFPSIDWFVDLLLVHCDIITI